MPTELDLHAFLFYVVAALTGLCALGVVVTQNIVRSAAWLLFALGGTAVIFFLLGADFVAATQLIVYVGGTLVLVVFGVMLTAQGPFITMKASPAEWAISTLVGILFFGMLVASILGEKNWRGATTPRTANALTPNTTVAIGESLLSVESATPTAKLAGGENAGLAALGASSVGLIASPTGHGSLLAGSMVFPGTVEKLQPTRTRMGYLLPFEIVSVHLLVVLIGAAYLARAKRRRGAVS